MYVLNYYFETGESFTNPELEDDILQTLNKVFGNIFTPSYGDLMYPNYHVGIESSRSLNSEELLKVEQVLSEKECYFKGCENV